jgi:hypothetical protein
VLGRDALQRDDEVLQRALLLGALGRLAVHQVVESTVVLEDVVDTGADAEDAEGEDPDTDDGNDAGLLVVLEPTEDTEEGCDDVDGEDGTAELPRGDGRPEGTVGTGDEDEPVLRERDLCMKLLVVVRDM